MELAIYLDWEECLSASSLFFWFSCFCWSLISIWSFYFCVRIELMWLLIFCVASCALLQKFSHISEEDGFEFRSWMHTLFRSFAKLRLYWVGELVRSSASFLGWQANPLRCSVLCPIPSFSRINSSCLLYSTLSSFCCELKFIDFKNMSKFQC